MLVPGLEGCTPNAALHPCAKLQAPKLTRKGLRMMLSTHHHVVLACAAAATDTARCSFLSMPNMLGMQVGQAGFQPCAVEILSPLAAPG